MAFWKKHLNGIHVDYNKNTMNSQTETMPTPDMVFISMSQHIGAPCVPIVNKNDEVKVGQLIGESDSTVSAPVHSSVSGKVIDIKQIMSIAGTKDPMVIIQTDKKQTFHESVKPPEVETKEEFLKAIRSSGLVGLGGAAFPTSVKYNPSNIDEVDVLIVNGAECEPYITSDYRTMVEDHEYIIDGIRLVMKYLDIDKCYIGIEDNKPMAIDILTKACAGDNDINVISLNSKYPKGAERVIIYETTGRVLGPGKLPADIGVLVSNITSIAYVSYFFETGIPLIRKRVTVDGTAVAEPKNVYAPIGTKIFELVDFCGGYQERPRKILMGGPMMGRAIYDDGKPLIKNNNAILAFGRNSIMRPKIETQCINCGRCVSTCPLNLMPTKIMKAYDKRDVKKLIELNVNICMECGCCSHACPAKKQLSLVSKLAKMTVKEAN